MPADPTTPPQEAQALRNWREALRPGDIVSFFFPTESDAELPKPRPCLVLDITRKRSQRYAVLAYGTTSGCLHYRGMEVRLLTPEKLSAAGLAKPTRFVGTHRIEVRLTDPRFIVNRAIGTPVFGRVDDETLVRVDGLRTKLRNDAFEVRQARRAQRDTDSRPLAMASDPTSRTLILSPRSIS